MVAIFSRESASDFWGISYYTALLCNVAVPYMLLAVVLYPNCLVFLNIL